jgi:hypothetical protein
MIVPISCRLLSDWKLFCSVLALLLGRFLVP